MSTPPPPLRSADASHQHVHADRGYEPITSNGAKIRADVVDVYVFARAPRTEVRNDPHADAGDAWPGRGGGGTEIQFLQLLRAGAPLDKTWQPVMGHANAGETSVACAWREMDEELGLKLGDPAILGMWALEQVYPFYIAAIDTVVISPRFCCEVRPSCEATTRLVAIVNHRETSLAIACERAFLATLDGSCRTPIAGHATVAKDTLTFHGETLTPDGRHVFSATRSGAVDDAARLGIDAALEVKAKGGSLIAP